VTEAARPRLWNDGVSPEDSFGGWLRRQREVREISLREIAEASKISIRYLEALEQDRFELLPAAVFAKGFLREYAKYVGLDADEVINYYLAARGKDEDRTETADEPEQERETTSNAGRWVLALIAGAVLVFLLIAAVSNYLKRASTGGEQQPSIAAPAVEVEVPADPSEPVAEETSAPLELTLDFTQSCWVEAWVDGERSVSELRIQGESLTLEAREEILLTLGNVAGASLELNGTPIEATAGDGGQMRFDLGSLSGAEENAG
jgi:cytoskeletal protein RodZ